MIKITGIGNALPNQKVTNEDLSKIMETSDEWIYSRTGIKSRYIAKDENNSDLAVKAIKDMECDYEDVDLIVIATFSPDHKTPNVANLVQGKLGLKDRDIMCLDINCACTGFIYALEVARSLMLSKKRMKKALVVASEIVTKALDFTNRNTSVLFGDGSGGLMLEKYDGENQLYEGFCSSKSDVDENLIARNSYLKDYKTNERQPETLLEMNGREVFKFAVRAIKTSIDETLEMNELNLEDIDIIIPHQANIRIIQKTAQTLDLGMDKFFVNIEEYGNTSAASIPIAIKDAYKKGVIKEGMKILLVGFGAGLSFGATIIKL